MAEDQVVETTETAAEKVFRQDDVDRIVQDRLAREREKAISTQTELEKRIAAYEADIEARKAAEMSEIERISAERDRANSKLEEMQGQVKAMQVDRLRSEAIAGSEAPNLPVAYRRMIEGDDAEQISASVQAVIEQYRKDLGAVSAPRPVGIVTQAGDSGDEPTASSPLQSLLASVARK